MKVRVYTRDDGRRAEERVIEHQDNDVRERVTETHVEKIPMGLQERVVERIVPVVTERKREVLNLDTGEVVNTVVERVSNDSMRLAAPTVTPVSREEIAAVVREALAQQSYPVVARKVPVSPVKKDITVNDLDEEVKPVSPKWNEWLGYILLVAVAGEVAFVLYTSVLKNML